MPCLTQRLAHRSWGNENCRIRACGVIARYPIIWATVRFGTLAWVARRPLGVAGRAGGVDEISGIGGPQGLNPLGLGGIASDDCASRFCVSGLSSSS
jgi:hypothetical protein